MKAVIWVLAYDEAEAAEWARSMNLGAAEWRYAENVELLGLAVKSDRFHWVGSRVRERPDYLPLAGIVRQKKLDWWRS